MAASEERTHVVAMTKTSFPTVPDPSETQELVYVHPGRTIAAVNGESLTTVVGSGAAVCVWDPVGRVGGMAHFLLPEVGNAPAASRFGDVAMKTLLEELARRGANPHRLRARVYGGSAPPIAAEGGHLGDRNVAQALAILTTKCVPVIDRDVGGKGARKVTFTPSMGTAEVQKIGT